MGNVFDSVCVFVCLIDLLISTIFLCWLNLNRLYYLYVPEGKEYPVFCRKKKGWVETVVSFVTGGLGKEEILLDWNELAEKYGRFLGLDAWRFTLFKW